MGIQFTKMHGLGNDFVLVDCRERELPAPSFYATRLCNRRSGIGADQLLLLCTSETADFRMQIYNADGSEVEMCGNGIRCLAKYIWDRGISDKPVLNIETLAGVIRPEMADGMVRVDMGEPVFAPENIPVNIGLQSGQKPPVIDYPLRTKDREFKATFVSMGNPHAVIFLDEDVSSFPVEVYGPEIEHSPIFPKRINVEFINIRSKNELNFRVWERGAGETMACGTGASAAGVAAMLKGLTDRKVIVHLPGGELGIEWRENNHVYMTGPAVEVFEGKTNPSADIDERRRHQRKEYHSEFEVFLKGMSNQFYCNAVSVDISETGLGLISEGVLEPGQVVLFKNKADASDSKVAIVKWSVKKDRKYMAGVMFIEGT